MRRPLTIHVEAGLRSFDDNMPEEVNRRLTDAVSDVLFVSDPAGMTNLDREGVPAARCFFVGNVMIDALLAARAEAMESPILETLGLGDRPYALVTLHRPSNVDDLAGLTALLGTLDEIAHWIPIVFPIHPRTRSASHPPRSCASNRASRSTRRRSRRSSSCHPRGPPESGPTDRSAPCSSPTPTSPTPTTKTRGKCSSR